MNINITIIIPVYNPPHDKFLKCIGSLMKQGGVNLEFIFVNDGSTDGWIAERLERLEQEDSRVVIITKENEGVSVARNTGMERAKGEYIAFVDSDDYMLDGGLEYMYRKTRQYDAEMGMFGYESEHYGGISKEKWNDIIEGEKKSGIIREIVAEYGDTPCFNNGISTTTPWAKLYHKNFVVKENIRFTQGVHFDEDNIFNLEAIGKAKRIVADNKKVYHYELVKDSLSNRIQQTFLPTSKIVIHNKKRLLAELGYDTEEINEALHFMTYLDVLKVDNGYLCDTTQNIPLAQRHKDFCALLDDEVISENIRRLSIETLKRYSINRKGQLARLFIYKHKLVWILTAKTWIKQKTMK